MARKFTPLYTSIWQNEAFRALEAVDQTAYFTLISQPNINSVGLLPITWKRWAGCSASWTPDSFNEAVGVLNERFTMCDYETEELLVRKFIEWDGGFNHPQRRKAIEKDALAIQSPRLREFVASEVARLKSAGQATPEALESDSRATEVPSVPGSSYVTTTGTLNLEPEPGAEAASGIGARLNPKFCEDHQPDGTDEDCGKCARARVRDQRQESEREKRAADKNARLAKQRRDCQQCDENGMVTNPDGSVSRCLVHLRSVS